ncbi:MAG: hypothetical protein NTV40_03705, partial [Solirubrobacterales bacterium]|nr:hypothetical protein [Solirubrobacterales bacterium]
MSSARSQAAPINMMGVLADGLDVYKRAFTTIWAVTLIFVVPVGVIGYFSTNSVILRVIYAVASIIIYLYITGFLIKIVQEVRLVGQAPIASIGTLLSAITPRLWPLFLLGIVVSLGVYIGLIFLVIPGVILLIIWSVAVQALIIEKCGVWSAINRSVALTRGNRLRILWLAVILLLIYLVLVLICGMLASVASIV